MSPVSIAFEVVNGEWYKRLPPEALSLIPKYATVPHEAVACGNSTAASFNT